MLFHIRIKFAVKQKLLFSYSIWYFEIEKFIISLFYLSYRILLVSISLYRCLQVMIKFNNVNKTIDHYKKISMRINILRSSKSKFKDIFNGINYSEQSWFTKETYIVRTNLLSTRHFQFILSSNDLVFEEK